VGEVTVDVKSVMDTWTKQAGFPLVLGTQCESPAGSSGPWAKSDVYSTPVQVDGVTVDVKSVMDTWTKQAGFPLVHASVVGGRVTLRQERFLLHHRRHRANNGSRAASSDDDEYAKLPINQSIDQSINLLSNKGPKSTYKSHQYTIRRCGWMNRRRFGLQKKVVDGPLNIFLQ